MNGLKSMWDQLGAKLGIVLCLAGFVALFLGWNGAASYDEVAAQFPYLISGGLVGLGLIVIGAAMMIVDANRLGRMEIQASLLELQQSLDRLDLGAQNGAARVLGAAADTVVAGASSYHRTDCRLVEGREHVSLLLIASAEAEGLAPCRICNPGTTTAPRARQLKAT